MIPDCQRAVGPGAYLGLSKPWRRLLLICLALGVSCQTPHTHAGRLPARPAPPAGPQPLLLRTVPIAAPQVEAGFSQELLVLVENLGSRPVAITALTLSGLGVGERRLAFAAGGHLRAFGTLPAGEQLRYRLGISYPQAGEGSVQLTAYYRVLSREGACQDPRRAAAHKARCAPQGVGLPPSLRVMEETPLPLQGHDEALTLSWPVRVRPRVFSRAAALARVRGMQTHADAATGQILYSQVLGGYFFERTQGNLLLRPHETLDLPGLSMAAVRLMEATGDTMAWLDEDGSLRKIPKGQLLRSQVERTLREGKHLGTAPYAEGKEALRVW